MFSWMSALTLPLSTATQPSCPRTVDPSMTTLLLLEIVKPAAPLPVPPPAPPSMLTFLMDRFCTLLSRSPCAGAFLMLRPAIEESTRFSRWNRALDPPTPVWACAPGPRSVQSWSQWMFILDPEIEKTWPPPSAWPKLVVPRKMIWKSVVSIGLLFCRCCSLPFWNFGGFGTAYSGTLSEVCQIQSLSGGYLHRRDDQRRT